MNKKSSAMNRHVLIIGMPEELDHHASREIKEEMEEADRKMDVHRTLFDFSKNRFMDSSGIGILLSRFKYMKAKGGDVVLCNVGERTYRVLRMSGIFSIMKCYETRQQALSDSATKV